MDGQMLSRGAAPEAANGDDAAMDQYASMGSLNSGQSGGELPLAPTVVDIKRLQKLKADQDQRLKALCTRVDRLTAQEQKVWKDVAYTQQRSLHAQEKQWQRQAQEADRSRLDREKMIGEQALRERARMTRIRSVEMKDGPRLQKFDENTAAGQQVREDAARHARALRHVRDQELQSKSMQVELQRQQRRQQKLQRDLEKTRREQARQDRNMLRFAELQEDMQNAELAITVAEREEISAVHRLQNSQTVRQEVECQLYDIERTSGTSSPRSAADFAADGATLGDQNGLPVNAPAAPAQSRSMTANTRNARSSPRLAAGSPRLSSRRSSGGAAPPPACGRLGLQGARSSPGLVVPTSVDRNDLGQITEEEAFAMDSTAAAKLASAGPRTRALQMQRQRQSPTQALSGNALLRHTSSPVSAGPRALPEDIPRDLQHRANMARRLQQNLTDPECRSAVKGKLEVGAA